MTSSCSREQADLLYDKARRGERAAIARALTEIERLSPAGERLLELSAMPPAPPGPGAIRGPGGTAWPPAAVLAPQIIGWTGAAGSGKSSLIAAFLSFRRRAIPEKKIAVIAVDPVSPFTDGSVLGDRIRMDELFLDPGVLIRSLSSRGGRGVFAPMVPGMARFLAAAGFDEVHIETTGSGQNDVDVKNIAETVVVATSPHSGDAIQGLKAGLLEIAHVLVVTKGDLDGAPAAAAGLETAVEEHADGWTPVVVTTSAKNGAGLEKLAEELARRARFLDENGRRAEFERLRRAFEFRSYFREEAEKALMNHDGFREAAREAGAGLVSPLSVARELVEKLKLRGERR